MIDITAIKDLYKTFSETNPGCSKENPIVLDNSDDYVPLEYDIVRYILKQREELMTYDITNQRLEYHSGRSFDVIVVNVMWLDRSQGKFLTAEEEYWFDITSCFNPLG